MSYITIILQSFVVMVLSPFNFKSLAGKTLVLPLLYPEFLTYRLMFSDKREQINVHSLKRIAWESNHPLKPVLRGNISSS